MQEKEMRPDPIMGQRFRLVIPKDLSPWSSAEELCTAIGKLGPAKYLVLQIDPWAQELIGEGLAWYHAVIQFSQFRSLRAVANALGVPLQDVVIW